MLYQLSYFPIGCDAYFTMMRSTLQAKKFDKFFAAGGMAAGNETQRREDTGKTVFRNSMPLCLCVKIKTHERRRRADLRIGRARGGPTSVSAGTAPGPPPTRRKTRKPGGSTSVSAGTAPGPPRRALQNGFSSTHTL